jgi:hypothetical protein
VPLIPLAVEITPLWEDTCSYNEAEIGSKHIRLKIVGVIHANGIVEQRVGRSNN